MRKIIAILIIGCLLATPVFASGPMNRFNADQTVLTVVQVNATGVTVATDLTSATVLVAGTHRILGFTICAGAANAETTTSLHDTAAATDNLTDTFIVEAEATASSSETVWFPYPKEISTGIVASVGAYTALTIYYERP